MSQFVIPQFLDAEKTMIGDYFPGGRIWPINEFLSHDQHLQPVQHWFINGLNYWRTIDEWHQRYWNNIHQLEAHLSLQKIDHWNKYFMLCKACFAPFNGEVYGNAHYLFKKTS